MNGSRLLSLLRLAERRVAEIDQAVVQQEQRIELLRSEGHDVVAAQVVLYGLEDVQQRCFAVRATLLENLYRH